MGKTFFYQFGASLIRNIGGEIGRKMRLNFYRLSGANIGKNVKIHEGITFYRPYNLEIGDGTEIGVGTVISSRKKIKIGRGVGIGPGCSIYDNDHKMPLEFGKESEMIDSPIEIGDGSWIGTRTIILKGVLIGKNVTVGAGSVVNKSVLDNAVVSGNPAKIIKYNQSK